MFKPKTNEQLDKLDILNVLYILAFPTKALTENNKRKWIRALGQIGIVIPMLPWTIMVCCFIIVAFIVVALLNTIIDWWIVV